MYRLVTYGEEADRHA